MITEDYVSFEVAKLLKEKGFKGQGEHFYEDNKITNYINYWPRITPKQRYEAIEAPTLQMAMKWLREVHHLHIIPEISDVSRLNPQYYVVIWLTTSKRESYILELFDSYEEACEEAIKYCLENLI